MRLLLTRALVAVSCLALVTLAVALWAIGHLAADEGDGEPCGGLFAAHVQLVLAYCAAGCLVWAAVALGRRTLGSGGSSLRFALPAAGGLLVAWFAVVSLPCAFAS